MADKSGLYNRRKTLLQNMAFVQVLFLLTIIINYNNFTTIIKNEEDILAQASSNQLENKRKRKAEFPDIEKCVLNWFKQC